MLEFINFLLVGLFIIFIGLIIFSWGIDVGIHGGNINYKKNQEDRIEHRLDTIELKLK